MRIKCIAIDDEPLALQIIKTLAQKFPVLNLINTFDDAISGAEFLRAHPVDLLFIDINMPDITGLDLVRSLKEKPMIIFTTAYKNFAIESYELDALDYLLKPIEQGRFEKAINKSVEYYRYKQSQINTYSEVLFVRSEYQLIKINLSDIEYIESMEDYCKIHLIHGKPIMTLMALKTLLEKLPGSKFKRIHRSYIIPLDKVRSFANRKVKLNFIELPVSASYVTAISDWMKSN